MDESRLVYDIMQTLGRFAAVYHCNSGSFKLPNGKWFRAMPKGFADIMAVLPGGKVAFIECKTDKGRLSDEQEKFLVRMKELGALSGVARTVSDALKICGIEPES